MRYGSSEVHGVWAVTEEFPVNLSYHENVDIETQGEYWSPHESRWDQDLNIIESKNHNSIPP